MDPYSQFQQFHQPMETSGNMGFFIDHKDGEEPESKPAGNVIHNHNYNNYNYDYGGGSGGNMYFTQR